MRPEESSQIDERLLRALLAADHAQAAGRERPRLPSTLEGGTSSIEPDEAHSLLELIRRLGRAGVAPGTPPPVPGDRELPLQLGRFTIEGILGWGGFGIVYLARDPLLGRPVALKVPRPEVLMSSGARRRFLTEARAAAGLDHPNLVPVYEVAEAGPLCYIASAYCPGPSLAGWLKDQSAPVRPDVAARLVAELAAAVQHAHDRGTLHRDIKPSNAMLSPRRTDETASGKDSGPLSHDASDVGDMTLRLTDFGLARILEETGEETRSGILLGSPPYMSPEQAAGRNREIGPGSDIYAMGATLYEILAGRPPFRGETPTETLRSVLEDDCTPLHALRTDLPRELETICMKCLEKDPARRYASASALRDDLERFLGGEPIHARPVGRIARFHRWSVHRDRIREAGFALLSLGLLTAGFGVLYFLAYLVGILNPARPGDFTLDLVVAFLAFDAPPIWCGLRTLAGKRDGLWLGLATSLNFLVWLLIALCGWSVLDYGGVFEDQTKEMPFELMLVLLVTHTLVRTGIGLTADHAGHRTKA